MARRWCLGRGLVQYDTDAGPLLTNLSRRDRRALGRGGEPGRGLVNAGMERIKKSRPAALF